MTGLFPSMVANELTKKSSYLLDWSRVGELVASGGHKYTQRELAQRAFILGVITYGGYVGSRYGQANGFFKKGFYSLAGCFVGFVVSHAVVIVPLVIKRQQIKAACDELQTQSLEIIKRVEISYQNHSKIVDLVVKMKNTIQSMMTLNLSDEEHARASQTLGSRLRLMEGVVARLTADETALSQAVDKDTVLKELVDFWSQDIQVLSLAFRDSNNDKSIEDEIGSTNTFRLA